MNTSNRRRGRRDTEPQGQPQAKPYGFPDAPSAPEAATIHDGNHQPPSARVTRLIGTLGKTFISTGVLILAFVGYQLWGTGLQEAQAQGDLRDNFEDVLEAARDLEPPIPTTSTAPVSVEEQPPATSTAPESDLPDGWYALLFPEGGEEVARIEIPSIDVDKIVVEGVQVADLRKGPGRYASTAVPGESGNAAIAGHRTTYGAPFHNIDQLVPGDEIKVTNILGEFTYQVLPQAEVNRIGFCAGFEPGEQLPTPVPDNAYGYFIVDPNDTCVLDDWGDNRLTLTACHPKFSARERIIVTAELVGSPIDTLDRPESPVAEEELLADDEQREVDEAEAAGAPGQEVGGDPNAPAASGDDRGANVVGQVEDLDEGLGWDYSALPSALFWGVAALAIWAMAAILARRLVKWPTYVVAFVPFAYLMFRSFEQLDRVLPAY